MYISTIKIHVENVKKTEFQLPSKSGKILICIYFLLIAAAAVQTHLKDSLFHGTLLPIALGIFICIIFIQKSKYISIFLMTLMSCFYLTFMFIFPDSIVGFDPGFFASEISSLMAQHNVQAIKNPFYKDSPLFLILSSVFGFVGDVNSRMSLILFPIMMGLLPVLVAAISHRISEQEPAMVALSSIIAGSLAIVNRYGFWPIPQSMATILLVSIIICLVALIDVDRIARLVIVFTILVASSVFTHKLPVLIVLMFLIFYRLYLYALGKNTMSLVLFWMLVITGVLLVIQLLYATDFAARVIIRISNVDMYVPQRDVSLSDASSFSPVLSQGTHYLYQFGNMIVVLLIGGVAWLYSLFTIVRKDDLKTLLISTIISSLVLLLVISYFNQFLGTPNRYLLFAGPFISIQIGIMLKQSFPNSIRKGKMIFYMRAMSVILVFMILLTSQLLSPAAFPDAPADNRDYLSNKDMNAKQFGYSYLDNRPVTDLYLANKPTVNPNKYGPSSFYKSYTPSILYSDLNNESFEYIFHRESIKIYQTERGLKRLNWSPVSLFHKDYNQVYSNSGVSIYAEDQTVSR